MRRLPISQNKLSRQAGLPRTTINMALLGQRSVNMEAAERILDALHIDGEEREWLMILAAISKLPRDVPDELRRRLEAIVCTFYQRPVPSDGRSSGSESV